MRFSARETVRSLLKDALSALVTDGTLPALPASIPVERAKRAEHGDFASNVALVVAKGAGKPPRTIAEALIAKLPKGGTSPLASADIAGPGFINLRLADRLWQGALAEILSAGGEWGRSPTREHPRILLEYLSANPTGPMHVAHGRHAAVGDALARVLRAGGYPTTCEFYINDAGNQVHMLSWSVWARYMEAAGKPVDFPENGYKGEYIRGFGRDLFARDGEKWVTASVDPATGAPGAETLEPIKAYAIERSLGLIRATLDRFDVQFDEWQSERALHTAGDVMETLSALRAKGFIDEHDNAVWLRTTALWGDDKDRVVMKSDGLPTYLLADIAYHRKKLARGFDELIDIWGADHHGHIARMKAALKAFDKDPDVLSVFLIQTVSLLRDGQEVKMGKRAGEFVTLDDVMEEVGKDATRFFYLMRRHDTPLDFDLELAKRQSMDNPVYYAQYGHARCASILRRAKELEAPEMPLSPELAAELTLPEELAIMRRLCDFPDYVADAAAAREPHRLTTYVMELTGEFQSYYTRLQKVHGDTILPQERHRQGDWRATWNWRKTAARLHWVAAVAQVTKNALALLGVSAPDAMTRSTTEDPTAE
jgi:arginyl-tRNA synthetase